MRLLSGILLLVSVLSAAPAQAESGSITAQPATSARAPKVSVDSDSVPAASAGDIASARRADSRAADLVSELDDTRTDPYSMVGVTWARGIDETKLLVEVRLRVAGRWSTWQELHVEEAGEQGGRGGTEPMWVGRADGIGVRVINPRGTVPKDVQVATIDTGATSSSDASSAASSASTGEASAVQAATSSPTYTSKPTIITRSAWGASAGTTCDAPTVGETTKGIVVHHTAGTNTYTKSQSASIVRGVQAYHIKSRDWCDIGYNFLIDKYGQIFEGRKGGMDRTVRGAHAGNFDVNTYAMGVSFMGNYDKVRPSDAAKASAVRLIGWRMGTFYFVSAKGSYDVGGLTLPRVAGHRNVISTACPGKYLYAWLGASGGLRDRLNYYISGYTSAAKTRYQELGVATTGPVYVGEYATAGGRKVRLTNMDILAKSALGAFAVGSLERTEYNRVGAQAGELGFPRTDRKGTAVDGVDVQRFEGGSIFRSDVTGTTKAFALWGPIAKAYADNGEASGVLGKPKGIIYTTSDGGKRANFENGYITYTAAAGAVVHVS